MSKKPKITITQVFNLTKAEAAELLVKALGYKPPPTLAGGIEVKVCYDLMDIQKRVDNYGDPDYDEFVGVKMTITEELP